MNWKKLAGTIIWLPLLAGCTLPGTLLDFSFTSSSQASSDPSSPPVVTSPPGATATPTPFLPLQPTQGAMDPSGPATPAWGDFPGPSVPPAVPIPPAAPPFTQPAGQINILLLGSDQRPYDGGFRTDTILLLTINPNQGTVHITSFPRDLYVYVPGWTMQRINTAHQRGGFEATVATFEYNFGVKPDHFMLINFWGFVEIVDNLGGIYVQVGQTLTDHRDGFGDYTIPQGTIYMDGETALWYVRSRYSTSDFERTRRQQEVLLAIFNRLISLDAVKRAPELFTAYQSNVDTDLQFGDVAPLIGLAAQIGADPSLIDNYYISRNEVTPYRIPTTGAQVLLPKQDLVLDIMRQALNAP